LGAVINHWAPSSLLESYETERRPVAARTIAEAARNMANLAPELADPRLTGSENEFARARPVVSAAIHATKDNEFHSLALTLGYDYRDSTIVANDECPETESESVEPGRYTPSAAPGHRLPHAWLAPGDSLYDHLGPEFSLVGDLSTQAAGGLVDAARSERVPLDLVDLQGESWRDLFGADLVLVRPDQHVAWRGDEARDPVAIIRRVIGHSSRSLPFRSRDFERTT
jgi:hypothetical protein